MKFLFWLILLTPFFINAQTVGFGAWGDCNMFNVKEYNPVTDPDGARYDRFGQSVSISGNFALVGSPYDNTGANNSQGSASIYMHNGVNWVFVQKLTDPTGAAYDYFGYSVSVSGNYAVVGAYRDDNPGAIDGGSASIYQYDGSSWLFMQTITDNTGAADDNFGWSAAVSGNYIIVGSPRDDVGAKVNQGSISFFKYDGASWVLMEKKTDPFGEANDNFGYSVSVSGTKAIVGAYLDDEKNFMGILYTDMGSASIYSTNGDNWTLQKKIINPPGGQDHFGQSVSISGDYAVVGGPLRLTNKGSVVFFRFDGTTWAYTSVIHGRSQDYLGQSVFMSANYVIANTLNTSSVPGSAVIYMRIGSGWTKFQHVTDPGGIPYRNSVIDETTKRFLIGAPEFGDYGGVAVFGKLNN